MLTTRRNFLVASSLAAASAAIPYPLSLASAGVPSPKEYAPFITKLREYNLSLTSFLTKNPLQQTNWAAKKLWDGGDDGLLGGALDYDLVGRIVQLYRATSDEVYLSQAVDVATFLKAAYLDPTESKLPAYRIYLAEGYYHLSKLLSSAEQEIAKGFKATVLQIAQNPGYAQLNSRTERAIFHPSLSREVALLALAKMYALELDPTSLKGGKNTLTPYLKAMSSHFSLFSRSLLSADKTTTLWGVEMSSLAKDPENYLTADEYVRPFMVGISARAAALLYSFVGDSKLLSQAADTLLALKQLYVQGKGLPYTDRMLPENSQARQLSSDTPDDSINPSLNLLIANACERVSIELNKLGDDRASIKAATLLQLTTQLRKDTTFTEGTLKETKQALY